MESNDTPICKVVLFGGCFSGKEELFKKWTQESKRIGIEYCKKTVTVNDKTVTLIIFDTAGQKEFRPIYKKYFLNSDVSVLLYSITNKDSFDEMKYWMNEIKENKDKKIKVIIVGTNTDKFDFNEVSEKEAEQYAKDNDVYYHTISCKLNDGTEELLKIIAKLFLSEQVNHNE